MNPVSTPSRSSNDRGVHRERTNRNTARTVGLAVAIAAIVLDQLTKSVVVSQLGADDEVHLVGSVRLIRRFNTGMAFSQGSGSPLVGWIVGVVVVALAAWVLRTLWRQPGSSGAPSIGYGAALGGLLGGALGNKIDRLVRRNGAVVDFFDVGFWPVFNVADAVLSVSCVWLVLLSLRRDAPRSSGSEKQRSR